MDIKYQFKYLDACNKANFTRDRVKNNFEEENNVNISKETAVENLQKSITYFENRIKFYKRAIEGASHFLGQLQSQDHLFDRVTALYWQLAFDPCSRHASEVLSSLDPVFEAVCEKLANLELGG